MSETVSGISPTIANPAAQRPVQDNIPPTAEQRDALAAAVAQYVRTHRPVAPLSFAELRSHVQKVMTAAGVADKYTPFVAVLVNNEVWAPALAAVPYNRRLLLLPQCLKSVDACRAKIDAMGLICGHCGSCRIDHLKKTAEGLGYVVLVAEGAAAVMSLIQTGQIQGIVGVSCLSALEKVYPLIEAAAVPAVALPLLQEGCANTTFDYEWVLRAIHSGGKGPSPFDLQDMHGQVDAWFTRTALEELLGQPGSTAQSLALDWLTTAGKRWRPLLVACVHAALAPRQDATYPRCLRALAVAVECFHKASLIHDDIEDSDEFRYGRATLHKAHGVPIALNVGDLLLGEGYRLIAQCGLEPPAVQLMLQVAADAHRNLGLGQGQELWWLRNPRPLSVDEVVDIFSGKTAPAFEVALRFGAACAGSEEKVRDVLVRYSRHLGVAYQIQDDLSDMHDADGGEGDLAAQRPSILLALAHESSQGDDREALEQVWRRQSPRGNGRLDALLLRTRAPQRAQEMLQSQLDQALAALSDLDQPALKQLLRQVVARIFHKWLPAVEGADQPRMGIVPEVETDSGS